MKIRTFGGTGYSSNCYLVTDDGETAAVIVDPSVPPEDVRRARGCALPPITAICLTHVHFDHMLALDAWREETDAPLCVHEADAGALGDPVRNVYRLFTGTDVTAAPAERLLRDGDRIAVGTEELTVWHTPGHTPGCVCYSAGSAVLTGDTLFASDVGRTDLPGGDADTLRASLAALRRRLPASALLYPGHGPGTTAAREAAYNPWFTE